MRLKLLFSRDKKLYVAIKNMAGFYPTNIHLYKLALHHKSQPLDEQAKISLNNERLEYLGDAVLSAVIADYLYKAYPYKNEGFLSEMRSKLVSRAQLNSLSKTIGLNTLIHQQSHSKSMDGDAFEAFIGALYLDKGYNFTEKIIIRNIVTKYFYLPDIEKQDNNYKSRLLEWSQKNKFFVEFKVIEEIPANLNYQKQYVVRVFIDGAPKETGQDFNIKGAEQLAAKNTFEIIQTDSNNQAS